MQKHTTSIKITDLWAATFTTLDGVKNMGFQVGTAFYSYTVTGFQQDLKADGKSSVRFYTSRGDTIYVSATAATLEMKAGGTVDIAAAQTLTRHLLSRATCSTTTWTWPDRSPATGRPLRTVPATTKTASTTKTK